MRGVGIKSKEEKRAYICPGRKDMQTDGKSIINGGSYFYRPVYLLSLFCYCFQAP